jgi:hypothetical protein
MNLQKWKEETSEKLKRLETNVSCRAEEWLQLKEQIASLKGTNETCIDNLRSDGAAGREKGTDRGDFWSTHLHCYRKEAKRGANDCFRQ